MVAPRAELRAAGEHRPPQVGKTQVANTCAKPAVKTRSTVGLECDQSTIVSLSQPFPHVERAVVIVENRRSLSGTYGKCHLCGFLMASNIGLARNRQLDPGFGSSNFCPIRLEDSLTANGIFRLWPQRFFPPASDPGKNSGDYP